MVGGGSCRAILQENNRGRIVAQGRRGVIEITRFGSVLPPHAFASVCSMGALLHVFSLVTVSVAHTDVAKTRCGCSSLVRP